MSEHRLASGVTLHFDDIGSGPPVVLLHGMLMSGQFFRRQVHALSSRYRLVIPDMRGHGRSEKVLHGHTVANYARDLKALLEHLNVERPVLVGWSMGAMVAYEYLKLVGQEAVAGLAIVDQPPSDFAWDGYEFGLLTPQSLAGFVEDVQMDLRAVAQSFADLMLHAPGPDDTTWMVEEITMVPPAVASTILVNQTLRDDREFIATLQLPTLVLFGRDDKVTSPEAGTYIAGQIPGAQLHIFERSSHCPFYEEPELFNEVLGRFLSEVVQA
jgi:non-heme chloroperoxidase